MPAAGQRVHARLCASQSSDCSLFRRLSPCKKQTIALRRRVLRRLSAWITEHPQYLGGGGRFPYMCSLFFLLPSFSSPPSTFLLVVLFSPSSFPLFFSFFSSLRRPPAGFYVHALDFGRSYTTHLHTAISRIGIMLMHMHSNMPGHGHIINDTMFSRLRSSFSFFFFFFFSFFCFCFGKLFVHCSRPRYHVPATDTHHGFTTLTRDMYTFILAGILGQLLVSCKVAGKTIYDDEDTVLTRDKYIFTRSHWDNCCCRRK